MDTNGTGKKIASLRKENNITQDALAEQIGVTAQAVSKWENGWNLPDFDNLMKISEILNVPYTVLIDDSNNKNSFEYRSKLFSEDAMFTKIKTVAQLENFSQTLTSLSYMREKHEGQFRKKSKFSNVRVKYINHPLMMACHAYAMGIKDDEILSAILLHDVVEDTDAALEELPISQEVKDIVNLVTFKILLGMTKEESKQVYYDNIAKNKKAIIVKIIDRCNNVSTMAMSFDKNKMADYIVETEKYIIPLISILKNTEYTNVAFVVKYQIISLLESIKALL